MNNRISIFLSVMFAGIMLLITGALEAHNPGYTIPSPGVPAADATITPDGTEGGGEWTGAHPFSISDYGGDITPLSASVKALHDDGIYLLLVITDASNSNNDLVQVRFDINHNGNPTPEATDWGIEVRRNGQARWGAANTNPGTWSDIPAENVGVASSAASWTTEIHLPTGVPSGLDLGTGSVGIYFMLYDVDQAFGLNTAKYTQWPQPPAKNLNALLDNSPANWGNYDFDPATTFPDLSVTGVRRGDSGPGNYYQISYMTNNTFEIRVQNSGGTVINDASNVRLNLYLAARGLGEPWHRLDTDAVLDGDCSAPQWASTLINKNKVCSGQVSLDDISAQTIDDVVNNAADYNIKDGMPMQRLDGESITIAGGTNNWVDVLEWNTTAAQDNFFMEVVVNNRTYRRQHQCMKAEAISANDPNLSNNVRQVNMDFYGIPGAAFTWLYFSIGWAGFSNYNPNTGQGMFLQIDTKNMDPQMGWSYQLEGVELINENLYRAVLSGIQPLSIQIGINAPPAEKLGRTLKENLMIPPKAGGRHANARANSGDSPVYVKVNAGATLWIVNYDFDEDDAQFIDLDGQNEVLRSNGPAGLPPFYLQKIGKKENLMYPEAPLGALIGSFDNFQTAFPVDEGVQVKVPAGASYLALGINDLRGDYNDNLGTGFRVKVIQKHGGSENLGVLGKFNNIFASEAVAQENPLQVIPILEVMPMVCINGYEKIEEKRNIDQTPHDLYRYIGNICWGVINVYPKDRSREPDLGDPFEPQSPPCACGTARASSVAFSSFLTILGIAIIGRKIRKKKAVK